MTMNTLIIVLAAISIVIAFILALCCLDDNNYFPLVVYFLTLIGTGVLGINLSEDSSPKAIEVYQGKTTLEVTYRDSIPVDSVVVYKK